MLKSNKTIVKEGKYCEAFIGRFPAIFTARVHLDGLLENAYSVRECEKSEKSFKNCRRHTSIQHRNQQTEPLQKSIMESKLTARPPALRSVPSPSGEGPQPRLRRGARGGHSRS